MMDKSIIFLVFGLIGFISCNAPSEDRLSHIADADVKSFLEEMLVKNGGLESWESIQNLKYSKKYELYTDSGTVEKSAQQVHDYKWLPTVSVRIVSQEGSDKKEIVFENKEIKEYVNDTLNEKASPESLTNNMQSSLFVISQPFKLADQGPDLTYEGVKTLNSGEQVHVLKAVYNSTLDDNLTTSDTWWVYFDKESYLMTGYMVKHLDHYSLVSNLESVEVNGFHFPKSRKSWRVNEQGDILYLRATYEYTDFIVVR
jgi:hypothetical protein